MENCINVLLSQVIYSLSYFFDFGLDHSGIEIPDPSGIG